MSNNCAIPTCTLRIQNLSSYTPALLCDFLVNYLFIFSAGAIISVAYRMIQQKIGSVAVHVAVGGVSKGKTNCSQVCLAAVGNYPSGCHMQLTECAARSYLSNGIPFLYDDPSNIEVLKPLLMNSFGGSKISTTFKESSPKCSPLVTVNEEILDDLSKQDERYSCCDIPMVTILTGYVTMIKNA